MKLYESDLCEAIYEVIANTDFKQDGEDFLKAIRLNDTDFELDKDNCRITISDNETGDVFTIRVNRTGCYKPQ